MSITWRHFRKLSQPGPRPHSLSLREESAVLHQEEERFRSPGPHFIQWVCIDELIPKRNIRPSNRGPASTTTEPELSARCPRPSWLPYRGFLPRARARMVRATGLRLHRLFPPAGAPPACQPGGRLPTQPPKSRRVYRLLQDTLQPRSLSENSRGDGTRLKRLPTFWVNLGQSLSFQFPLW